jgi:hypothetical protein
MSGMADAWKKIFAGLTIAVVFCSYSFPFVASASVIKRSFITATGLQAWPVPGDFNSYDNTVEVIGGGGGGGDQANSGGGSGGGGGGAYSKISGVYLIGTTSLMVQVGTAGPAGAPATTGGDTFFMRTAGVATTCSAGNMAVCASGGGGGDDAAVGAGGAAASEPHQALELLSIAVVLAVLDRQQSTQVVAAEELLVLMGRVETVELLGLALQVQAGVAMAVVLQD